MSKLSKNAKNSKLSQHDTSDVKKEPEKKLIRQIKAKEHPRSYRLDPETMNDLKATMDRVNEISPRRVSEARLVKALIHIAPQIEDEELLRALKEVW